MSHLFPRVRLLWAAALFLAALLAAPTPIQAQDETPNPTEEPTAEGTVEGPITFEALFIRLWPEYDRPSMLVQYQGVLSMDTEGEAQLQFTMPEGSEFLVAAVLNADGSMLDATGLYSVEGQVISFLSPNGTFHIEFYAPMDLSAENRSYTHTWSDPYAVKTLYWVVQEPKGAEEFTTTPTGTPGNPDALGLNYFRADVTDVAAGQAETMTVTYVKTDNRLTCQQINCTPPQQAAPETTSSSSGGFNIDNNTLAVAALALVGLGLVGGGVYLYRRNRAAEEAYFEERRDARQDRPPRRRRTSAARSTGGTRLFCTQCGAEAADPSDRFCRRCGAPLRSPAS